MTKFKTVEFIAENKAGAVDKINIDVLLDSTGIFYAHVPDKLLVSFDEDKVDEHPRFRRTRKREGFFVTRAKTYNELIATIKKAHEAFLKPSIKEEPVIRYNIESHVSFALTKDGRIVPNGYYEDAHWTKDESYGDHNSCRRAQGGYSLTVGAEALLKKTTTYGDKFSVSYEAYYKGESHLGGDNPAQLLNSWTSMDLPKDAKEMPYSDEAAMFFFNLLKGMAELNRRIQEFTNTPEKLALAISRHSGAFLLENKRS